MKKITFYVGLSLLLCSSFGLGVVLGHTPVIKPGVFPAPEVKVSTPVTVMRITQQQADAALTHLIAKGCLKINDLHMVYIDPAREDCR